MVICFVEETLFDSFFYNIFITNFLLFKNNNLLLPKFRKIPYHTLPLKKIGNEYANKKWKLT